MILCRCNALMFVSSVIIQGWMLVLVLAVSAGRTVNTGIFHCL